MTTLADVVDAVVGGGTQWDTKALEIVAAGGATIAVLSIANDEGPCGIQHRPRRSRLSSRQHISRISADRARAAIRQLNHQMQHASETAEPRRRQQLPEQRMRWPSHPHRTRQHRTKMLQSVAITARHPETHLADEGSQPGW